MVSWMGPMRILIVDDSPVFLLAAGDAMEEQGYEVETARNGAEGVELARKIKPDLIIMDIEMPIMMGTKAAMELRSDPELASVPIIAMTSFSPDSLGEDIKLFNDCLTKPFGFSEIIPMVKTLLEKKKSS